MIYSIPAARAALPGKLSRKWVVVGHSQGGEAALGVSELEAVFRDPNYLGAVSIAPLTYLVDTLKGLTNIVYPGTAGYLPLVANGVKAVFPSTRYEDILTPAAQARLSLAPLFTPAPAGTQLGCLYTASAAFGDFVNYDQVFRTEPGKGINHPALQAYSALNQPGTVKAFGPIFVAQGVEDEVIPAAVTDRAVAKLCSVGSRVFYKKYPFTAGAFYTPHTDSVYASFDDQMTWIGQRFAGEAAPNSCR